MRKFLVTKFACAKCNSNLHIADGPMPKWAPHESGEPTGCETHENVILLEPCQKCMQPLEDMRQAARTLMAGGGVA